MDLGTRSYHFSDVVDITAVELVNRWLQFLKLFLDLPQFEGLGGRRLLLCLLLTHVLQYVEFIPTILQLPVWFGSYVAPMASEDSMTCLALFASRNIVVLAEGGFSGKSPEFCFGFYDWSGPAVVIEGGEVEHRVIFLGGGGPVVSQFGEGGGYYFRFDQPVFFVFLSEEGFIATVHLCLFAVEFDIFDELFEIYSCFSPLLVGNI